MNFNFSKERFLTLFRYKPYLYIIFSLLCSILLLDAFVEIAETTFLKPLIHLLDLLIINFVQQFVAPRVTAAMLVITNSGSSTFYFFASIFVCAAFLYQRQIQKLLLFLVCLGGGGVLNVVLKHLFERTRPDIFPLIAESGYSFPSGHAMGAICFYGILSFFISLHLHKNWQRFLLCALTIIYILLIGLSRIYLGVHYPTDIAAGYTAGATWLFFCIALYWILNRK